MPVSAAFGHNSIFLHFAPSSCSECRVLVILASVMRVPTGFLLPPPYNQPPEGPGSHSAPCGHNPKHNPSVQQQPSSSSPRSESCTSHAPPLPNLISSLCLPFYAEVALALPRTQEAASPPAKSCTLDAQQTESLHLSQSGFECRPAQHTVPALKHSKALCYYDCLQ